MEFSIVRMVFIIHVLYFFNELIDGKILKRPSGLSSHEEKSSQYGEKVIFQDGVLNKVYSESVWKTLEYHYNFQLDLSIDPPSAVRLKTRIIDETSSDPTPILVTVRSSKGTMNWNLPYEAKDIKYPSMERTLCLVD